MGWPFTSPHLRRAGGRIEFLASVRGYELTTRVELLADEAEHPRTKEEYFKIQLGPLERWRIDCGG